MARQLGIRPSTYDRYERDRVPPADLLAKVADVARVTLEWLVTGEGPKQVETVADLEAEALTREFKEILVTRPDVRPMAAAFLTWISHQPATPSKDHFVGAKTWRTVPLVGSTGDELPTDVRRALREGKDVFDEDFARTASSEQCGRIESAALNALHHARATSAAGVSSKATTEQVRVLRFNDSARCVGSIQVAELPDDWGERLVGIELADDSMTPDIPIGCIAVVAIGRRPEDGEIGVALLSGSAELLVRRYHSEVDDVLLVPSNPRVDVTRVANEQVEFAYRVVAVVTPS